MASDKEYVRYVLEQLSGLEEISTRAMMGEYILYYRGKVAGGIYDNRLFIKPVAAAVAQFENPIYEIPYPGAREMLLVDRLDDREFLTELFRAMYEQLPAPKKKASGGNRKG